MLSLFYDFETSDQHFLGQILDFAFVLVDEEFAELDRFTGTIRLSRLQLPHPRAILTNRIDVLEHQRTARFTERSAVREIASFIEGAIGRARGRAVLAGYNSARFDLPYLRTTLIRNGLNPYFSGNLAYRDLLLTVRCLAVREPAFPLPRAERAGDSEEGARLSLRLESVARELGILETAQRHAALDDVLLTIELAKKLRRDYSADLRTYETYCGAELHSGKRRGEPYYLLEPDYAAGSEERARKVPVVLLDADTRYALWVDLARFEAAPGQHKRAVMLFKQTGSTFVAEPMPASESRWRALAGEALQALRGVSLGNFFETSVCDIEQDIYRVDFDALDALSQALWKRDKRRLRALENPDLEKLHLRHALANYEWGNGKDEQVREHLRAYAHERYGGELLLRRSEPEPGADRGRDYHPSLAELFSELDRLREAAGADSEDRRILESLRAFYVESDIYAVAGAELLTAEALRNPA